MSEETQTPDQLPRIRAPWTDEQMEGLKRWQKRGDVHPFTCCDHQTMDVIRQGFICPKCGRIQDWAHSMMADAPTGLTYRFSTFQELVDRVPGDKICDCMEELGAIIGVTKLTVQLQYAVACNLAKADGKELPPEPAQVIKLPDVFEWIDDGNRTLEARVRGGNEKPLFTVKIVKKDEQ